MKKSLLALATLGLFSCGENEIIPQEINSQKLPQTYFINEGKVIKEGYLGERYEFSIQYVDYNANPDEIVRTTFYASDKKESVVMDQRINVGDYVKFGSHLGLSREHIVGLQDFYTITRN